MDPQVISIRVQIMRMAVDLVVAGKSGRNPDETAENLLNWIVKPFKDRTDRSALDDMIESMKRQNDYEPEMAESEFDKR